MIAPDARIEFGRCEWGGLLSVQRRIAGPPLVTRLSGNPEPCLGSSMRIMAGGAKRALPSPQDPGLTGNLTDYWRIKIPDNPRRPRTEGLFVGPSPQDPGLTGNLLLERLAGAYIELITKQEYAAHGSEALLKSERLPSPVGKDAPPSLPDIHLLDFSLRGAAAK